MFAAFNHSVRFGDLAESKDLMNNNLDFTGFQQRPDSFAQRLCYARLLLDAPRAQRRAGDSQPPHHDRHEVEIGNGASLKKSDLDQPPFERQQIDILLDVRSADHVENNVDAAGPGNPLDLGCEIVSSIVDDMVGAQSQTERCFLFIAHGCENDGAELLRDLDGGVADSARTAVDQYVFARLEASADHQVCPNGEKVLRNGGGGGKIEASGE